MASGRSDDDGGGGGGGILRHRHHPSSSSSPPKTTTNAEDEGRHCNGTDDVNNGGSAHPSLTKKTHRQQNTTQPTKAPYTKFIVPPPGRNLFDTIASVDATPPFVRNAAVVVTAVSLSTLPFVPRYLASTLRRSRRAALDNVDEYDEESSSSSSMEELFASASGVPIATLRQLFLASMGCYAGLFVLDAMLHRLYNQSRSSPRSRKQRCWWDDPQRRGEHEGHVCYDDMFGEPCRHGRLVRRPGNTASNVLYLFGALAILSGVALGGRGDDEVEEEKTMCLASDGIFGIMLLILALSSTAWHSLNVPWIHYVDIWSMEACIVYLMIRTSSLGIYTLLLPSARFSLLEPHDAATVASRICTALYLLHIVSNGRKWSQRYRNKWLHKSCPFSARTRLRSMAGAASCPSPSSGADARGNDNSSSHDDNNKKESTDKTANGADHNSTDDDKQRRQQEQQEWQDCIDRRTAHFTPPDKPVPINVFDVCVYAFLPVVFLFAPIGIMVYLLGIVGSERAAIWTNASLVVGWTYRMWERWTLDGCAPLRWVIGDSGGGGSGSGHGVDDEDGISIKKDGGCNDEGASTPTARLSLPRIVGAAILSPTAVLHVATGVTLLAGFAHARSLDVALLAGGGA